MIIGDAAAKGNVKIRTRQGIDRPRGARALRFGRKIRTIWRMKDREWALLHCMGAVVALLLWQTAGAALLGRLLPAPGRAGNTAWYLGLFALGLALCRAGRVGPFALGLRRSRVGAQLLWGLLLTLALAALFVGVPLLAGFAPTQFLGAAAPSRAAMLQNGLFFLLLVGPAEELIFRGYLNAQLRRAALGPFFTAALSSLAFGAYHYLSARSLLQVACTALIGLALSLPKEKRPEACTLLSVTVAHGLYNLLLECLRWRFC